ncbi:APC family permease [Spiroplasma monobiae]|uniref:Permease n=1 Tax=Spiroplasma monobiae MQ-1 TaxID=1336748 RepID=A0A2K9LV49_SPISQ|nr:APC family permease [Spiroplasma monobiae]AUM62918.1 hypothetical protein SMONO_v1c06690 [Spiroplasma monobiae MQ-1]
MKTKKEQLGLFSIIWIGFTFIAGITFTASFGQIVLAKDGSGVGINIIWIFVLEGFIAFMCAWAFAKLVKYHPQANGGGSQYVRTAFGKFWGLLMGFFNYSVIPVIGMALIVTMVRANFDSEMWGRWSNLYLDLIGFALYIFAATIIFFGIKKYKYVGLIIGYLTWGITLLLMIFGLTAGFMNLEVNSDPFRPYLDATLDLPGFTKAFTTCFFAFGGIETFITTGKNIKNRSRNMPIAIIVIMIATTAFYIIFSTITMFAVAGGSFESNPNTQLFPEGNFLRTFGPVLIIICTILMRFNSSLQITMFGGSTLEPLSSQGYISPKFKKENKENIPVAGVFATIGLFIICATIFLFIPDIIQGITGEESPLNYATIASCASLLLIAIYGTIIPTVIVQGVRKNVKVQIWEYIGWIVTGLFLLFVFGAYVWTSLLNPFVKPNPDQAKQIQAVVSSVFQILYVTGVVVWAVIQYHLYYKPKMAKMDSNSERAKEIAEYENFFRLLSTDEMEKIALQQAKEDEEYKQYKLQIKAEKTKNKAVSK